MTNLFRAHYTFVEVPHKNALWFILHFDWMSSFTASDPILIRWCRATEVDARATLVAYTQLGGRYERHGDLPYMFLTALCWVHPEHTPDPMLDDILDSVGSSNFRLSSGATKIQRLRKI